MFSVGAVLSKAETWAAGTLLVSMVGLVLLGGVARFMHTPLNWTIDAATCAFAWATFLCADIAWRKNALMSVDLIVNRLPVTLRKGADLINYFLIVLFLTFIIIAGIWLSWVSWTRSFRGIPWISYSWVTLSLPCGGALLLNTTVMRARREFFGQSAAEWEKRSC